MDEEKRKGSNGNKYRKNQSKDCNEKQRHKPN